MSAENIYKNISEFVSQGINTCISLLKVLLLSRFNIQLPHADEQSCIVLGNGPSLNQSLQKHPGFFKKHPLICVNSFSTTNEYTLLKPSYYVILDPGFWYGDSDLVRNTVEALKTKTTWTVYLLVPRIAKQSKKFLIRMVF